MLSRLPVIQPTIGPPETTLETSCDSTEPEAKRTKRSDEHNPFAVFQEVRSRRSRQPKASRRAELLPCRSQIRDTLDAHRQRETKWTTDAEPALLIELWGRMARREARAFEFVFKKRVKGQIVEVTFTAKSVKRKLAAGPRRSLFVAAIDGRVRGRAFLDVVMFGVRGGTERAA